MKSPSDESARRRSTLPPMPAAARASAAFVDEGLEPHVAQLVAVAELLLGAAHADGHVDWAERSAIGRVLAGFVGVGQLPQEVGQRIQSFDPKGFDIRSAVARLTIKTRRDRRELLQLVSRVVDADAELHAEEEGYLRRIAAAVGADDDEVREFLTPD